MRYDVSRHLSAATLLLCGCSSAAPPRAVDRGTITPPRVVGYLASWGVRSKGTRIDQLPAHQLTHIFYAFGKIGPDGRVALGDPCADIGLCSDTTMIASPPGG